MSDKDKTLKAGSNLLNSLHQMVAMDLANRIKSGEATIQEINAAIKFLKDNEITADPEFSRPLRQLEQEVAPVGELPFVSEEDDDET